MKLSDHFHHLPEGVKLAGDVLSIATLLGWLASILPHAATALTVIWMFIRIWETKTVGRLIGRKDDE